MNDECSYLSFLLYFSPKFGLYKMKPVTHHYTHTTNSLVIKVRIQNVNTMIFLMEEHFELDF